MVIVVGLDYMPSLQIPSFILKTETSIIISKKI